MAANDSSVGSHPRLPIPVLRTALDDMRPRLRAVLVGESEPGWFIGREERPWLEPLGHVRKRGRLQRGSTPPRWWAHPGGRGRRRLGSGIVEFHMGHDAEDRGDPAGGEDREDPEDEGRGGRRRKPLLRGGRVGEEVDEHHPEDPDDRKPCEDAPEDGEDDQKRAQPEEDADSRIWRIGPRRMRVAAVCPEGFVRGAATSHPREPGRSRSLGWRRPGPPSGPHSDAAPRKAGSAAAADLRRTNGQEADGQPGSGIRPRLAASVRALAPRPTSRSRPTERLACELPRTGSPSLRQGRGTRADRIAA